MGAFVHAYCFPWGEPCFRYHLINCVRLLEKNKVKILRHCSFNLENFPKLIRLNPLLLLQIRESKAASMQRTTNTLFKQETWLVSRHINKYSVFKAFIQYICTYIHGPFMIHLNTYRWMTNWFCHWWWCLLYSRSLGAGTWSPRWGESRGWPRRPRAGGSCCSSWPCQYVCWESSLCTEPGGGAPGAAIIECTGRTKERVLHRLGIWNYIFLEKM